MDQSSDDEDVLHLCNELGIKLQKKVKRQTMNIENIDINNLPVILAAEEIQSEIHAPPLTQPLEIYSNYLSLPSLPHTPMSALTDVPESYKGLSEFLAIGDATEPHLQTYNVFNTATVDVTSSCMSTTVETSKVVSVDSVSLSTPPVDMSFLEPVEAISTECEPTSLLCSNELQEEEIRLSSVQGEIVNTIPSTDEIEEYGDLSACRKRCSKGCADKKKWTKNSSKVLRMEGNEYLGYRRDSKEKKFQGSS